MSETADTHDPRPYDYVIVGGGTAGCVLAARLTEDPDVRVCLVEGGPTDQGNDEVLLLKNWVSLLEGPLDYAYGTVEQPRGNSFITHSRARVLGGCSSHNTMISFFPLPCDLDEWAALGAEGWDAASFLPYAKRVQANVVPVAEKDRNPVAVDFLQAAHHARSACRSSTTSTPSPSPTASAFFSLGYYPEDGRRSSSSVAYLHDVMGTGRTSTIEFETRVLQIEFDDQRRATGVRMRRDDGSTAVARAGPRGGPLRRLGRHARGCCCSPASARPRSSPSSASRSSPTCPASASTSSTIPSRSSCGRRRDRSRRQGVMDFDAGLFVRRDPSLSSPDLMFHFGTVPWTLNTGRLGFFAPEHGISMTPNIPKPRTSGRLYLTSPDPDVQAGAGLPLLRRRRLRRGRARRRHEDRPEDRRHRSAGPLDRARGRARAARGQRRGPLRLRPLRRAHRLPPERHLPDGFAVRPAGRRRPRRCASARSATCASSTARSSRACRPSTP